MDNTIKTNTPIINNTCDAAQFVACISLCKNTISYEDKYNCIKECINAFSYTHKPN